MEGIPSVEIISGMASLREEGLLCDIELEAEGKTISAHKVLLSTVSPYFRALFNGNFREAGEKRVTLKEINFESLKIIIDCFYTPGLVLTDENVSGILCVAHILQISSIIRQCETFVENNISASTCFSFLKLAETYDMKTVISKANRYVLENFASVHQMEDFKKVSKDALLQYLNSDELNTGADEAEVYVALKDWLEYSEERMQWAAEMMKSVRFKLMKSDMLDEIADSAMIDEHKEHRMLVRNALRYHAKMFEKPLVDDEQCRPRGTSAFYILDQCHGPRNTYASSTKTVGNIFWIKEDISVEPSSIDSLGLFVLDSMKTIAINNFLFLFAIDQGSFTPVAKRYDASSGEWINLTPAPQKATVGSCLARFEDHIYLFGGMYVNETSEFAYKEEFTTEVFEYNIGKNSWAKLPDIPERTCEAAATSSATNVYVSGGYTPPDAHAVPTVHAYNVKAKVWLTMPSMNHARGEHCMEAVADKIFVFGGATDGTMRTMVPKTEVFDVVSQQWTDIEGLELEQAHSSTTVMESGEIYILGGVIPDYTSGFCNLSGFQVFDPKSNHYRVSDIELPRGFGFAHISELLTIPACPSRPKVLDSVHFSANSRIIGPIDE